jgi:hypothetical protein
MNYIFLDIDGVMNNQEDWLNKVRNNSEDFEDHRMFCDEAWELLSAVCEKTKAKVVLSSSWRVGFKDHNGHIVCKSDTDYLSQKLLSYFEKYNIELVGLTTTYYDYRGKQIHDYVKRNLFVTDKWVVLDDEDCDIRDYCAKEQMIKTEWLTGLLPEHCERIVNYFKGE